MKLTEQKTDHAAGKKPAGLHVRAVMVPALLFAMALATPVIASAGDASLGGEVIKVEISSSPFCLRVMDNSGKTLLETIGGVRFTTVRWQEPCQFISWWCWTRGFSLPATEADVVLSVRRDGDALVADLGSDPSGPVLARIRASFHNGRALRVEVMALDRPEVNRTTLRFRSDADDRYYGMGERFNRAEHKGERVSVWAEEGALGISSLSKVWPNFRYNPFPTGQDTTYCPMPFFLNPKGYGFLLDDTRYSLFDFGKTRKDVLEITNWNRRFDFMLFHGPSPLEVIEAQTAYTGRITPPLPWAFAPWNVAVKGAERAREVARIVREEKIPCSAIWSEDWWWRTEWELNRERYPDYEKMIAEMHADGFRCLSYYQPYVSPGTRAYEEGDANGYLTKNKKGDTYDFTMSIWKKAQVDLTNPAAREWWKQSFFQTSESHGIDGWMHDFGEYTPPDSVARDGRGGWELHNEYPVLWARLGREFWDQARPDGDYAFFVRGGYTGVQKYASIMWTGDQNSNFEKLDGLPSNIPGITSVGISGHPLCTTDIAGYHCLMSRPADKELFMRWTEFGALLPIMRNHRGNSELCDHWAFDSDRETLLHYKKYAELHTALFPYIYTLVYEAAARGWPVVRHMVLHYPDDAEAASLDYQYLLGDRLLVAPVLERDAREWKVYFPEGKWLHYFSGVTYAGPGYAVVPAPLDEIPLFIKSGSILPVFDSRIDTLVKESRDDLNGWDDADSSMRVVFAGHGEDSFNLWDGTIISCARPPGAPGTCGISGGPPRTYSFEFRG